MIINLILRFRFNLFKFGVAVYLMSSHDMFPLIKSKKSDVLIALRTAKYTLQMNGMLALK